MINEKLAKELRYQQQIFKYRENIVQNYQKDSQNLNNSIAYTKADHNLLIALILGYLATCCYASDWTGLFKGDVGTFMADFLVAPFLAYNKIPWIWDRYSVYLGIFGTYMPNIVNFFHFLLYTIVIWVILHFIQKPRKNRKVKQLTKELNDITTTYNLDVSRANDAFKGHPKFNLPNYQSWYVGRLAQIVETGQASTIGSAVRLLETNLRSENLGRKLDAARAASERAERAARNAERAANRAEDSADSAEAASYFNNNKNNWY